MYNILFIVVTVFVYSSNEYDHNMIPWETVQHRDEDWVEQSKVRFVLNNSKCKSVSMQGYISLFALSLLCKYSDLSLLCKVMSIYLL